MSLREVLDVARVAPSIHNTQPWRFEASGDHLELWAERSRLLPVIDPKGRQLVVSCGAALEHAVVAARGLGEELRVWTFPDPARPELLATAVLGPGAPPTEHEGALLQATSLRHTYRGRFTPEPLAEQAIQRLSTLEVLGPTAVRWVQSPDDLTVFQVLLARADSEQRRDPAYRAELDQWVHASGGHGIPSWAQDRRDGAGSSLALRHFEDLDELLVEDPPVADHPAIAVLATGDDGQQDWLEAGRALARFLLEATVLGLAAQPLGQVTDSLPWRMRLGQELGVLGRPQLAVRLGYPAHLGSATPRRDLGPAER